MTWDEASQLDRNLVVVVPFGATEQHSYHLPLGTDAFIIEGIARELDKQIGQKICILPTTFLGCSRHHMDFAGSLTAHVDTFIKVGEQLVDSMAQHGFTKFMLLNGHGGNIDKLSIICENLTYRPNQHLTVIGVTYWHLIREEIRDIRETASGGMGHACELETSLMLLLNANLVHKERMEAGALNRGTRFLSGDMFDPGSIVMTRPFHELSQHGGLGDPAKASVEKGQLILNATLKKLIQVVADMHSSLL